ncbi:LysR substrate-binding domain-containing protein [Neorhizobium sp. T6_25]|uniref:LysR substrate-binding domain-containing protein n=1 Tax=Neorhizobium sp. T6_25 TaxID=2093833 RepID=UPI00352B8A1F
MEKDMIARRLSKDDRLVLVASESYLAHTDLFTHPRDLGRHRILIRRPRSGVAQPWSLSRNRETVRIDGEASLSVDSAIAARQFAIAGLGLALLAYEFVAAQLKAGLLHLVLPDWQQPVAGFHLMYVHRGNLPPPVWELERAVRQLADRVQPT